MPTTGSWEDWDDVIGSLDPETDSHLYEAAIDQAMTLEIGLAARCHVNLDRVLYATVVALCGASVPTSASTASLLARVKKSLNETPLRGPGANNAAHEALEFARHANRRRNRVLHDQWIAIFDEDGPSLERTDTGTIGNISPTRETLSSISNVSEELTSAYYRILGILLYAKISCGLTDEEIAAECKTAFDLIRGHSSRRRH